MSRISSRFDFGLEVVRTGPLWTLYSRSCRVGSQSLFLCFYIFTRKKNTCVCVCSSKYKRCCEIKCNCGSDSKESACDAGDVGSIPGSGRSPGGGNSNPLQYSCQRIPWAEEPGSPWGHKESDTNEWLNNNKDTVSALQGFTGQWGDRHWVNNY